MDETLFVRTGRFRTQSWCTSVVDVTAGRRATLVEVVEGRTADAVSDWINAQPDEWRAGIDWGVLDMSGPYRKVYNDSLPDAVQVADPFHVVKVRHEALCIRRRVRDPPRWAVAAAR